MLTCADVSTSGAAPEVGGGTALGFGTATARGAGGVACPAGEDFGAVAFSGLGVFSGFGVDFPDFPLRVVLDFAVSFFVDFFFANFGFGVGLGDSSASDEDGFASGVSVDFVDGDAGFFPARVRADAVGFGVGLGDSVGVVFGVGEGLFVGFGFRFDDFGLGLGLGDWSGDEDLVERASSRVFRNSSRLRFSSSLTWARRSVVKIALSARAVASQTRKRTTAAERNREKNAFKPPARQGRLVSTSGPVHVRGERSRSIFRQGEETDRSDTSR
jgi:hypothetical protein